MDCDENTQPQVAERTEEIRATPQRLCICGEYCHIRCNKCPHCGIPFPASQRKMALGPPRKHATNLLAQLHKKANQLNQLGYDVLILTHKQNLVHHSYQRIAIPGSALNFSKKYENVHLLWKSYMNHTTSKNDSQETQANTTSDRDGQVTRANSGERKDGQVTRANSGERNSQETQTNTTSEKDSQVTRANTTCERDSQVTRANSGEKDNQETRANSGEREDSQVAQANSGDRDGQVTRANTTSERDGQVATCKKRRVRCGQCDGCKRPKCLHCTNCINPRWKKACLCRRCLNPPGH